MTELSHEELLSRTYLRVLGTSTLPHLHDYSRPLAGDLVESIAVDCPDTVLTPSEELVAEHGADAMREAGLLNVLAEPIESHEALDLPGGGVVHVASGSSVYVASKLLVLPDVLRRTIGESDVTYGVLVAVPFRHQLFFHVLVDSTAVAAIDALVSLAATGYGEGVGPVSPYVYWWRDGAPLTQVSFRGEDDQLHVRIGPELDEVLGILSRRPPGK